MSENYNIFKVLNFKEKETIHSAMIAAIASYNDKSRESFFGMLMRIAEKKAIGKAFDKKIEFMIKNTIDFNSNKFGHWIKNEAQLWESVNRNTGKVSVNRGRADIWIGTNREIWKGTDGKDETKQYRLIIENKISAGNQDHQLRRYYRYLTETSEKKNHREFAGLFFLCPIYDDHFKQQANESAKTYNNESKKGDETNYAVITYKDDIIPWLKEVMKTAKDDFRKVVNDYYELVVDLVKDRDPNWDDNKE